MTVCILGVTNDQIALTVDRCVRRPRSGNDLDVDCRELDGGLAPDAGADIGRRQHRGRVRTARRSIAGAAADYGRTSGGWHTFPSGSDCGRRDRGAHPQSRTKEQHSQVTNRQDVASRSPKQIGVSPSARPSIPGLSLAPGRHGGIDRPVQRTGSRSLSGILAAADETAEQLPGRCRIPTPSVPAGGQPTADRWGWCCQHGCGFRYAGDMSGLTGSTACGY